jgi:stearoyl-CoA 9-desaturase NADPH oxidoreductase
MSATFQERLRSFLSQTLFNTRSTRAYFEPLAENWIPSYSLLSPKAHVVKADIERDDILHLYLKPNFMWRGFVPGQYVELGVEINGSVKERIFSISSSISQYRTEGIIRLSIQKQKNGQVTPFLFEGLKVGTHVQLGRAAGQFILPDTGKQALLLIAGGAGITPFMSMLSSAPHQDREITLLYYANSVHPHLLRNELESLSDKVQIRMIYTDREGRFNAEQLHRHCPDFSERNILICGPSEMEAAVRTTLLAQGVEQTALSSESFSATACHTPSVGLVEEVRISLSRSYQEFKAANNKSILEILESKGLSPRFGCRMGICNECSCKKISGTVMNRRDNTLSHAGEEFIRICSAIPAGDLVLEF